jgi:predicted HicB family RNase H-like nuclease
MEIEPHIEAIRDDLAAAAAIGGEQSAKAAEPLLRALDPALRLRLFELLSQSAAEISSGMPAGHVELRMEGRDAVLTYVADAVEPDLEPESVPLDDDGSQARITLRMPDGLKRRVEEAAAREGISANAWLVRAASSGLERKKHTVGRRITGYAQS